MSAMNKMSTMNKMVIAAASATMAVEGIQIKPLNADGIEEIKIVITGDGAVGKTCMLTSYVNNAIPGGYIPTVFDNYKARTMYKNRPIELALWDTAGQDEYDSLRELAYPDTHAFILAYSTISPESLNHIKNKWYPEMKRMNPTAPFIIVATKTDCRSDPEHIQDLRERNQRPVTTAEGQALAKELGAHAFVECSAVTQEGLNEAMNMAVDAALWNTQVERAGIWDGLRTTVAQRTSNFFGGLSGFFRRRAN